MTPFPPRTGTVLLHLLSSLGEMSLSSSMQLLASSHRARGCSHCALKRGQLEARSQEEQAARVGKVVFTRADKIRQAAGGEQ